MLLSRLSGEKMLHAVLPPDVGSSSGLKTDTALSLISPGTIKLELFSALSPSGGRC